ncbi:nodulation protein NodH [Sinisalibacter aestuarii]|nr:nodulation protein NodH [Sinisalibacter aestuarii]
MFDSFVILAEMRTGSNFLESNINEVPGLHSYGEAFNPHIMCKPGQTELLGVTLAERDADPLRLIRRMREQADGIYGFRLFHDHDARVFDHVMEDRRCAKVILNRNIVDSWVSQRIAWSTNQWALQDVKDAKKWRVKFDPDDFRHLYFTIKERQILIARRLQETGQAGFYLDYDDIQDIKVINGLIRFLGVSFELEAFSGKFKKQNPETLADKVRNFPVLEATVNEIDRYDLGSLPNFEPMRNPVVPSYVTTEKAPLLYMPMQGGPDREVKAWLAAIDGVKPEDLATGFTQRDLRKWKRQHPGHRSFTVLRHPASRAHAAFCRHFLIGGPDTYSEIRQSLIDTYKVPLPAAIPPDNGYDVEKHREAFLAFLGFVASNLNGQTPIRIDGSWATQGHVVQGFGQFLLPDHILREDDLAAGLAEIAHEVGVEAPELPDIEPDAPFTLADIYDNEIEEAVRKAYQRDFMLFGYRPWRRGA